MSSIIQQVINKAMVFALTRTGQVSSSSISPSTILQSNEFKELVDEVNRLNADELGYKFDEQFMRRYSHWAPCSFMEIYENERISASVFTIRGRREIPLHDHPTMYGILKVIHGRVRIISYSYLNQQQRSNVHDEWNRLGGGQRIGKLFKESVNRLEERNVMAVVEDGVRILSKDDPPAILTPSEYNIHRVQALEDDDEEQHAAFVDVIVPPYSPVESTRECHYFRLLEPTAAIEVPAATTGATTNRQGTATATEEGIAKKVAWLMRIPAPPTYWCDSAEYRGPPIKSMTDTELREAVKKNF